MPVEYNRLIRLLKRDQIPLYQRGEEPYERSVATNNLLFRFARPDFVLQPETPQHVQTIVRLAAEQKLRLIIKCGGHSYAGHSTAVKGSISLDLRRMNKVRLDMTSKTITFGGGCQWGNVYKALINGHYDGFVINGGRCPFVGVGGYLLGGGLGPFSRSIGMGSDTVKEFTIITADGVMRTVKDTDSDATKEGQLFWALRGAGASAFGVVVEMKLAVHKLETTNGKVVAGRYTWFAGQGNADLYNQDYFLRTMNEFYTTNWPETITIDSTWVCDLREKTGNGVRFITYFDGNKEKFDEIITRYIRQPDLAKQLKRRTLEEKSTRFLHETLVSLWSEETIKAFPTNKTYSLYSSFVFTNEPGIIRQVTEVVRDKIVKFRQAFSDERVQFVATFIHAGGKMSQNVASSFFWREGNYHMYLDVEWEDKWMEQDMRDFLTDAQQALRPLSLQGTAAFVNFPDSTMSGDAYERAYWGNNSEELRRIKAIWDKDDLFRTKQSVRLPGGRAPATTGNDENVADSLASSQWESYDSVETEDFSKILKSLARMNFVGL